MITLEQMLIGAAALAVAAWPHIKTVVLWAYDKATTATKNAEGVLLKDVAYERAFHDLAIVRNRLVSTGMLNEAEKKAIDTLTLALIAGSDK